VEPRERLARMPVADFQSGAPPRPNRALDDYGIAFTLYSKSNAVDRILPFDAIPRVLRAAEWKQRQHLLPISMT